MRIIPEEETNMSVRFLLADGYNKDGVLKKNIIHEQMEEFMNPIAMLSRYSMMSFMKTMASRILKPLNIRK